MHTILMNRHMLQKYMIIVALSISIGILSIFPKILISVSIILISFIIFYTVLKRPYRFFYLLLYIIIFQNFFAIFLAKFSNYTITSGFILLKDILTYIALFVTFFSNFKKIKFNHIDLLAILSILLLWIYLLFTKDVSAVAKIIQFRQLSTPIVLYLLGRFAAPKEERLNALIKHIVKLAIIAVLFGFVERFIFGDAFWIKIGIVDYMQSKGMGSWAYANGGLPGNFYSYDFSSFIGMPIRRMVSFVADPTLFGQFLAIPIAILLFTDLFKSKKRIFYFIIIFIGLLLTLSKGGMFSVAIMLVYRVFKSRFRPFGVLALGISVIVVLTILLNAEKISSLPNHINGLSSNIRLLASHYFGIGLGKSGNFAELYGKGSEEGDIGAGESFVGMLIGQLGVFSIPIILFYLFIVNYYRKSYKNNQINKVLVAALLGILSSAIISESAISFVSSGFLFLLSGIFIAQKNAVSEKMRKNVDTIGIKQIN